MSRLRLMGAAVVVAGIGIVNVASLQSFSMHAGDLWVLSSAFVFGTGAVLFKKYLSHVMPELAIAIRNVAGITIVFIVSLFFRYSFIDEVMAFPMEKVILLLAFAFFSRYLSLSFFYEALDRLPATTFSLIQIANPLSGLVFAMLILGENIESYQILGGLFIVFGLLLEQCSEHALQSLRSHWLYFHFPLKRRAEMAREIQMLPKHI
jgi:drug/metabolite transporter (DMT)-like permease